VMCESMMQVAARVMGQRPNAHAQRRCGGQFQLNIMMRSWDTLRWRASLLAAASRAFVISAPKDWRPNPEACQASVEKSLSMVTSLNPYIGYEAAAKLAKDAFASGKTIRELLCRRRESCPKQHCSKL